MRIRTKIILCIILPIFAVDLLVTAINSYTNYDALKSMAEGRFVSDTELIAAKVSAENTRGVAVAKSAAEAASILFGNRVGSVRLIKDILGEFPNFIGASVGYEVNADLADFGTELGLKNLRDGKEVTADGGIDAYDFASNKTHVSMDEWIAKSEGGRFVVYWTRAKGELSLEPLTGMDTAMYSAGLRKKMEAGDKESFIVTEPYIYSNNVMMVEYAAPIYHDGKYSGQVAFDRDLAGISSYINTMKTFKGGDIFLISSQGRIIAATKNENLRAVPLDDLLTDENGNFTLALSRDENGQVSRDESAASLDISKYRTAYRDMLKSAFETAKNSALVDSADRRISLFTDSKTGEVFCVSQKLVRPGNWVVVHIAPRSEIVSAVYSATLREFAGMGIYVVALFVSILFMRGTFDRISRSSEIAETLALGKIRFEMPHTEASSDESGRLVRAVLKTAARIRSFVLRIKFSGHEISGVSAEIDRSSERYDAEMRELGGMLAAVSDSVKQLGEGSASLCDMSDKLSQNASDGAQAANEGRRKISEMEYSIGVFTRSTSSVARRLAVISERAGNIGAAVATIAKVSEETNLLSLNASIEAEKAGASGVGFAVVAREIGRLAEQSAAAVEEITSIVRDMRNAVDSGVSEMDKFAEEIRTGGADIGRLVSEMEELAAKMQAISPQVERLASGIRSQRLDITKVGDAMAGVGEAMRQSELVMREVSAVRAQLKESSEKLSSEISSFESEPKGGA